MRQAEVSDNSYKGQSGTESFSFDFSEVESSVIVHEVNDGVELTVYERRFVGDYHYRHNGRGLVVVMIDFSDGDVEPALEAADEALYYAPFFLQGFYSLHMHMCFQYTDNHVYPFR